jgi:hypothetical protein
MASRKPIGWQGVLPSEDLPEEHERTDPNVEMPAFGEVGSEEATRIDIRMPDFPKLTLPRPQSDASSSPLPLPAPAIEKPVLDFPVALEPKKPKKEDHKLFTKEVILTMIGGVLLLAGAFVYTHSGDDEPEDKPVMIAPAQLPPKPPPEVVKAPEPVQVPEPVKDPEPVKTATPIVSILSNPSGARVEINGTIYGNTPLIQPSPANVRSLSIRLLKDNYKPFETIVSPNEAGHFNLNATLEKR